jgi:translation initiation factor 3 subunit I
MRPLLMKGHERPLTFLRFNRDGDLLFSCAKDHHPTVWYADNGERIGTYNGHNGAVWCCDVTRDSRTLVTGSADATVKLWDVESGRCLFTFDMKVPVKSTEFSVGENLLLITTDPFMGAPSQIHVKRIAKDVADQEDDTLLTIKGPQGRINRAVWGPLNKTIISAGEDGVVRMWDAESGELLEESEAHEKAVTSLALSPDGSHFITASADKTAKLFDTRTLETLKTYQAEARVNAAAISPLLDHVVIGGGQEAQNVTTTSSRAGKFEAKFFHKIYEEEIGGVKGHFGPINSLAFCPDGRGFASGGEDGYVRMHHFDPQYFTMKV